MGGAEGQTDLVGHVGAEVDGEGEGSVGRLHKVTQLLTALQLRHTAHRSTHKHTHTLTHTQYNDYTL